MKIYNMFNGHTQIFVPHVVAGPLLTQQDFDTDVYSLVQRYSAEELIRRSRPLAYQSDLLGNVFYDNMPDELRKSFEKAYQEQKTLELKQKENAEVLKKLQEHYEAKKTGIQSPHEDFVSQFFGVTIEKPTETPKVE